MSVGTASLGVVMRDAKTIQEGRAAAAGRSQNPRAKTGPPGFDPCLPVRSLLACGDAALRRSEPRCFYQNNSESTRNAYSSRIPLNALKINVGAASYPQLKQGVFAPLNLTGFASLPRIRDRVEHTVTGKIAWA
jgi:hypothetical protein